MISEQSEREEETHEQLIRDHKSNSIQFVADGQVVSSSESHTQ